MEYFWGLNVTYDFMWDIFWQNFDILGLQPRDKAAMLGVNTLEFFLEEYSHEDGVQFRREMFLFLITNMATMMSHAN